MLTDGLGQEDQSGVFGKTGVLFWGRGLSPEKVISLRFLQAGFALLRQEGALDGGEETFPYWGRVSRDADGGLCDFHGACGISHTRNPRNENTVDSG